jgi:ABC-type Fe3+-siderophore transport system permease subunit
MSGSKPADRTGLATDASLYVGAVLSMVFMIHAGEPHRLHWWPMFAVAFAWVLLPYAIVRQEARRRTGQPGPRIVLLVAAIALTVFSAIVMYGAFIAHPDPQSGLVFIFIPLYQLLGLVPFFILARYLANRPGRMG